jgi:hypothetical protein
MNVVRLNTCKLIQQLNKFRQTMKNNPNVKVNKKNEKKRELNEKEK